MKNIDIAKTLVAKRSEKGITQDELAKFIGVSKASVSKWEKGHSYPDITFLPQLASYFDISLDELMGYEPQMTDEDIRKLYVELSNEFATKPFDDVMNRCRDIIKKYFSCFPLLFQIGALFMNYSPASKDEENKISILTEAKALFIRVKTLCENIELKQLALHSEAVCEMMLCNSNKVIALLENEKRLFSFYPSIEVMLSQSYKELGDMQEAKIILQGSILNSFVALFYNIPHYLEINFDDIDHFEEICKRTIEMIEIFNAKKVYPMAILPFYISAAKGFLTNGNTNKALAMLETYTEIVTGDILPLTPKRDNFFTFVEELHVKMLKDLPFGMPDLPRDEQSVKQSIIGAVVENPVFSVLDDEPRYKALSEKMQTMKITLSR